MKKIVLIFLLALVLRLAIIPAYTPHLIGDEIWSIEVSASVFGDYPLSTPVCPTKLEPICCPCPASYRPFFYPLLLSPFASSLFWMRVLNCVIAALIVIPAFYLAKHYYGERVALLASLFIALQPSLIYAGVQLTNRSLIILLVLAAYLAAVHKRPVVFGVLAGFCYLTNQTALYFLPILFMVLSNGRKKALLVALLVVSPWLVRNYIVFGDPLFTPVKYMTTFHNWPEVNTLAAPRPLSVYIDDLGGFPLGWVKAVGIRLANTVLTYVPVWKASKPLESVLFYQGVGVFGLLVLPLGLAFMLRAFSRLEWNSMMSTVVFASIACSLLYGGFMATGKANESLMPLVPVYSILCAACVQGKPRSQKFLIISLLLQGVLMAFVWGKGI